MQENNEPSARRINPWLFFPLTFFLTWIFWIPIALSGQPVMRSWLIFPLLAGGFGPSIVGIIMVYRTKDREGRRDFWRRSLRFKQIGAVWFAAILVLFPVVFGLGILLDVLLGGSPPGAAGLLQAAAQPAFLLVAVIMSLVIGPLAEEFGWRGFVLDHMQSKWTALVSSLILGAFWWVWHFPEFFMTGIPTGDIVSGPLPFVTFAGNVFAMSILYTWVYNNTEHSILAVILMHFMYNFTQNGLSPISDRADVFKTLLLVVTAVVVVVIWGPKTLTRPQEPPGPPLPAEGTA